MVPKTPISKSLVPKSHPSHYLMHKYWARKPHNIVRAYIEYFTKPNEIVLDPFAGSGVTLIEALSCGRKAVAVDINPIASLITEVSVADFNEDSTMNLFQVIKDEVEVKINCYYKTLCSLCNSSASVNYFVWENIGYCQHCSSEIPLSTSEKVGSKYVCPKCRNLNIITSKKIEGERLVSINYSCPKCNNKKSLNKSPDSFDLKLIEEIENLNFTNPIKNNKMFKNKRTLIHDHVTVESFFTRRNFYGLSLILNEINKIKDSSILKLFEFIFTSGVAQASKLIPFRNNLSTGGPAWSVPGFWIPNLHLEINPWNCFENRFEKVVRGKKQLASVLNRTKYEFSSSFAELSESNKVKAWILNTSSTFLDAYIPDESVDYIFTDPPYGDSVPYLEFSSIWNAWINRNPDYKNEIVISNSGERKKDLEDYSSLLRQVFSQCYRVLKPGRWLSLTFNNRDLNVWKAILEAAGEANFRLVNSVYQAPAVVPSKARLAQAGSTIGDIILNFIKPVNREDVRQNQSPFPVRELILSTAERIIAERGGQATTDELLRGVTLALLSENRLQNFEEDNFLTILKDRFIEHEGNWRFNEKEATLVNKYKQINEIIMETVIRCKDCGITDKREVIAEVFSVLQGSQTPSIKTVLSVYDKVYKGQSVNTGEKIKRQKRRNQVVYQPSLF